jgi:hypothetical protein
MVDGISSQLHRGQNLLVTFHIRAGPSFRAFENRLQCLALEDGAGALEAGNGDLLIPGISQPIWIYDWVNIGVLGDNADVSTGEWCDQRNAHGGEIVQSRRTEQVVVQGACVSIQREYLDVRPVAAKGSVKAGPRVIRDSPSGELFKC